MRYIKLYFISWSQSLQAQMEYKLDFMVGNLATILGQIVGIAFVWVIFQNIGDLNGWTLPEIMLMYGLAALPFGLLELFFDGLWGLNFLIRMGEFDRYLVRPVGPLFLVLSDRAATHSVGNFLSGVVIIAIASGQLGLTWSVGNIGFVVLAVACGVVIYLSINIVTATSSFFFVGSGTAIMFLVHSLRNFSSYPLNIYARPIQMLLIWIVPFAFTSFFPATHLLQRDEFRIFVYLIPVVPLVIFALAYGLWRMGLNQYQSTGS